MDSLALHKLSYGLYILTTSVEAIPYGCIINTAFQITSKPAQIAISCNRDNFTHDKIMKSQKFAISVLPEDISPNIIATFGYKSGRDYDKFKEISYVIGEKLNLPIFTKEAVATFECKVVDKLEVGTHTIFIGSVEECNINREDADEMTYRYYREIRNGVAPKNSPTYIEPATGKDSWRCSVCGYIYNREKPSFSELEEDWVCPICGAKKSLFIKN